MSVWEFIILGIVLAVIREKFFGPSEADKRELEMRAQRAEDAARQRRARVDDDDDEYENFVEEQRRQEQVKEQRRQNEFIVSYNNGDYN